MNAPLPGALSPLINDYIFPNLLLQDYNSPLASLEGLGLHFFLVAKATLMEPLLGSIQWVLVLKIGCCVHTKRQEERENGREKEMGEEERLQVRGINVVTMNA